MKRQGSRIPGFHRLCVRDRIRLSGLSDISLELATGGLLPVHADNMVEDVVGVISYPLSIAPNFMVNGTDVFVPMSTEEPSVVAAAARGAKAARQTGGFRAEVSDPVTTAQILLLSPESDAETRLAENREALLNELRGRHPTIESMGGGPKELTWYRLDPDRLVVLIHADTRDALGANVVDSLAEALAPRLESLTGADAIGAIITNAMPERKVTVRASFPVDSLARGEYSPQEAAQRFLHMASWAKDDPMRAVTHNKGIMNGVVAVAMATGQDIRALEAGAHFMASGNGRYGPLSSWHLDGDVLAGTLTIPHTFATVGGMVSRHSLAGVLMKKLNMDSSDRLASIAASAGLACNFSALSVLATEGIQKGHMRLHRRAEKSQD